MNEKNTNLTLFFENAGREGGTRTHNLRFRKPLLYPIELLPYFSRRGGRNRTYICGIRHRRFSRVKLLLFIVMAGEAGFEPTTFGFVDRCSIQIELLPCKMEERAGFEPAVPFGTMVFKTIALGRSATSPDVARETGIEPATCGFEDHCSIQIELLPCFRAGGRIRTCEYVICNHTPSTTWVRLLVEERMGFEPMIIVYQL